MRRLTVIGACAAGASALAFAAYRKDLDAAEQRIRAGRQFIDSPHGPIEFGETGVGPAALFVHGAGGGFDQGLALGAAFLGDGYRIVAPSRFGYLGTPLPADASPEAQADAHLRLLDALDLERVPVIGISAGGPSVLQLALRHPERCSALILIAPMPWTAQRSAVSARFSPAFVPVLEAMASSDFLFWTAMKVARTSLVKALLGTPVSVFRKATAEERRNVDEVLRAILPIHRRYAGIGNDAEVASSLVQGALETMRVPTLVISAADDLYDTYESGLHTAEQIRDARFVGFSSGGHLLLGHEGEVRSEIERFLREHVRATKAVAV
jgi:2-hydroxy-6-oxonona-2,4-dienedioate hydrolase